MLIVPLSKTIFNIDIFIDLIIIFIFFFNKTKIEVQIQITKCNPTDIETFEILYEHKVFF